eukprot:2969227-Rhodomonas_salina.1
MKVQYLTLSLARPGSNRAEAQQCCCSELECIVHFNPEIAFTTKHEGAPLHPGPRSPYGCAKSEDVVEDLRAPLSRRRHLTCRPPTTPPTCFHSPSRLSLPAQRGCQHPARQM